MVAPDAEMDYLQDNVQYQSGCQLSNDHSHVPVNLVISEPDRHLNLNIILNIVTTFYNNTYAYFMRFHLTHRYPSSENTRLYQLELNICYISQVNLSVSPEK